MKKPLWTRGGGNWRTLTKVKIPCSNTVSLAYGEVNIVLREPIDTWQAHWPCFSMYTFGNVNEQSLPRSPLLGYSSMTISGSFPWSGFQNHVHFSTRLLVTHFNMASVPTGTEVSVGISTKLTLAGTRNKMNLTIDLIFWFFFFHFPRNIGWRTMEKRKIFLSRFETNFFPSSQFIPVGRRLTVAGGASCKIPSGDNRTPHVHNPSSSYKIFLNLTEQSWSASLFGLNFLTNRGSWLEFEAFQDHSHCTTGLFTRHLRSTDSPDATWIPLDNCTNSTVKQNQRPFLSFLTKYFTTRFVYTRIYKLQAKMGQEFKFRCLSFFSHLPK